MEMTPNTYTGIPCPRPGCGGSLRVEQDEYGIYVRCSLCARNPRQRYIAPPRIRKPRNGAQLA